MQRMFKKLSSAQLIMGSFALVILTGALLLMLPVASRDGTSTTFLGALFTAVSSVCVTGLVVYDTATHWTIFGQGIIILLIQIGGMGVVTVAAAVALASGSRISLRYRSTMQDAISAPQVGGIVRFTGFILKGIFLVEAVGAFALAWVFIPEFDFPQGLWMAVFHSISAFCNAGFDLMGQQAQFSSLTRYAAHGYMNLVIILLVVIGGLGFLTWEDICRNRFRFTRYRMQSKVILFITAVLLLVPALYFFFFEFDALSGKERFWTSLFQSVTLRTAGFNTVDFATISESGLMMMSLIMLIGGAPGSTAGGMKITTFVVLLATAIAGSRREHSGHLFGRRISDETVKNAVTVFLLYVVLFLLGGMLISRIEDLPIVTCLFESASAVGTVGCSLGATPTLSSASRVILIMQMFFGRVGGLTMVYATLTANKDTLSRLPLENISVG
ncbi:MAG: Trk family potassium uptake protein [Oscillospiraceae bacterium]|nr:Trk family potassium uptake protein [Oscillospiraceae bacterium]